jgi:hypothetical protein
VHYGISGAALLAVVAVGHAHTDLYLGGKHVSRLAPEAATVFDMPLGGGDQLQIERTGTHVFVYDPGQIPLSYTGYARIRPGPVWYVNFYARGRVVTIGTVRLRKAGVWDAYCGLNGAAYHFGYATGPNAGLGAVGLILTFGNCLDTALPGG